MVDGVDGLIIDAQPCSLKLMRGSSAPRSLTKQIYILTRYSSCLAILLVAKAVHVHSFLLV